VRYQDLVSNPEQTIYAIYDFLEIQKFPHDFTNLRWEAMANETNVFGITNMHSVMSSLKPSQTDVSILSDYIRGKYANALEFLAPVVKI
jgi:hypothetical protein